VSGSAEQDHGESSCSLAGECRQLVQTHRELLTKLDSIEKRLFRDNGSVSIQTRLDRHEQILRVVLWIVGIIGGTFLAACVGGLVIVVRELIVRGAP